MFKLKRSPLIILIASVAIAPVAVLAANFDSLTIKTGFRQSTVNGFTGGSYSFSEQFSSRDRNGKQCLGFGDTNPDHILTLQNDFPKLNLQVSSGGNDTTLVMQGPNDETLRCGDDSDRSRDASIKDVNVPAGTYKIWVGSVQPGQRWNYRLSVSE
ncbi:hypothetical protein [Oscillatoria sp. FACHB-1406]|uniref:hypothetical protein n=1 Tax=Oscillatoria sp. FACHB-1406 TaxID=2692846 RepID=UPI0016888CB8|nr:hypothetical protein [Oscillatoria sp. FACHB-1406]MBD2580439.1 hypothetical protein [Oscillatoria sp. FACHB-1406]